MLAERSAVVCCESLLGRAPDESTGSETRQFLDAMPAGYTLHAYAGGDLEVQAVAGDRRVVQAVPASQLVFEPVRYRPLPSRVGGLDNFQQSLDGLWRINPQGSDADRTRPFKDSVWKEFRVPGQWKQQGFDIPAEQPVAVGSEFSVPANWSGRRIFLRFDAIHAGTDYWLNGQPLGHSENLFTPVEWEITAQVRPGEQNRLDLGMKVDTLSEKLSYSSGYAFHSLGGIDRSVRVFALPAVHSKNLRVASQLDEHYQDADLTLTLGLENPGPAAANDLHITLALIGPDGQDTVRATRQVAVEPLPAGTKTLDISTHVDDPLKWNAEHPHLYRAVVELRHGDQLFERVERSVGFRRIEVKAATCSSTACRSSWPARATMKPIRSPVAPIRCGMRRKTCGCSRQPI